MANLELESDIPLKEHRLLFGQFPLFAGIGLSQLVLESCLVEFLFEMLH